MKAKVKYIKCPVCGREHKEHPLYGCFCCLSCLQVVIRPLIVALEDAQLRAKQQRIVDKSNELLELVSGD